MIGNYLIRKKILIFLVFLVVSTGFASVLFSQKVKATFITSDPLITHVEIDGVDFGTFREISKLSDITSQRTPDGKYILLNIQRDFVADRSLYSWAKEVSEKNSGLSDIDLILKTPAGDVVNRFVLKLCKPLSWEFEVVPSTGGFFEKVEFVVQDVAVHSSHSI